MANKIKGEVVVELFGKRFTLTPSNEAIMQIEGEGFSIPSMLMNLKKGMSMTHMAALIHGCLVAQKVETYSLKEVFAEIRRNRMSSYAVSCATLLVHMVTPEEAEAEMKAEERVKPEEPKV